MRRNTRPGLEFPALAGLALAAALTGMAGCSVQRMAIGSMVPILEGSLAEAYASGDVETVREAISSQVLLLRGLARADSQQVATWTTAVQLYAAYALIFVEVSDPERAARLYREGMELGLAFLRRQDGIREAWDRGPDALREEIRRRRPAALAPLMMWTAACMGKHVLGHLDRPREMADLPYAYVLADAAIEMDERHFYGMPLALKGVILAATPLGLGGDLPAADEHFRRARDVAGANFLFHEVLYARYYCVAALDRERFIRALERVVATPAECLPAARLVNLIAKQHAQALLAERDGLF